LSEISGKKIILRKKKRKSKLTLTFLNKIIFSSTFSVSIKALTLFVLNKKVDYSSKIK